MSITDRGASRRAWFRVAALGVAATASTGLLASGPAGAFGALEPVAVVTATPTTGEAPLVVTFDGSASTSPNPLASWAWDFGDGTTGSGAIVSHTYATAGSYQATLVVADTLGLVSFPRAVTITVTPTTLPSAPVGLVVTARTRTSISLAWSNPGTNQTSIVVERCRGARCTGFRRVATLPSTATSFVSSGLARATTYRFRVRTVNAVGSAVSTPLTARTAT